MTSYFLTSGTLLVREIRRFLRQRSRVVGALGTPIVFWFLIGSGLGTSFKGSGAASHVNYLSYFFPGTIALILLFTAIFSTISIIEDRREGFLQAVLVSPAPRSAVALGKILGGTVLAAGQAAVFLLIAPVIGLRMSMDQVIVLLVLMFVMAFALTGLGFLIAWKMESTQGFHAIMNLFLMPMWFLSGALFPASGAPAWLRAVMAINPLTYGVRALHELLFAGTAGAVASGFAVTAVFAAVMFGSASALAARS